MPEPLRIDDAPAGTPLYLHLPFCARKCGYCDFFSVPGAGHDVDGMLDAILAELRRRAPRDPRTVYFGGGTPSYLSCAQLERLIEGVEDRTGFRGSAEEVTLECNPESLDLEKARLLAALGVDRLSIGFQSLEPGTLALFGRVHGVRDSFRAFEAARGAGFRRLNVDLIYAAPGQTLERWGRDLERVLDLEPEHVSAYNLTFEEGTQFQRWLEDGRIGRAPEELELELFAHARRQLPERGLDAYEISNYARPGEECRHNLGYWRNGPYIGVGPSAVSKVGTTRAGNTKALAAYQRAAEGAGSAIEWAEDPGPGTRLAETWWLGLRLAEGVEPGAARRAAGFESGPEDDPALDLARGLARSGHLEERAGRFRLSASGLPLADALARRFLTRLAGSAPAA